MHDLNKLKQLEYFDCFVGILLQAGWQSLNPTTSHSLALLKYPVPATEHDYLNEEN